MRNNNSKWPLIKLGQGRAVLGAAKTNIPPVSRNSPINTGMMIWYWLGLMRTHRSSSLLFYRTGWRFVLPSLMVLFKQQDLLLRLHRRPCPESIIWLMTHATHCAPGDEAVISHGPADQNRTYPSPLLIYLRFSYFSRCLGFCFGSADV